MEVGTTTFASL